MIGINKYRKKWISLFYLISVIICVGSFTSNCLIKFKIKTIVFLNNDDMREKERGWEREK